MSRYLLFRDSNSTEQTIIISVDTINVKIYLTIDFEDDFSGYGLRKKIQKGLVSIFLNR